MIGRASTEQFAIKVLKLDKALRKLEKTKDAPILSQSSLKNVSREIAPLTSLLVGLVSSTRSVASSSGRD